MALNEFAQLAEIAIAILTLIGIIVSLFMSIKALREVQIDRRQRQTPSLAFEPGGHKFPIKFIKSGKRIIGKNPAFVEAVLEDLPDDIVTNQPAYLITTDGKPYMFGKLRNYGLGPALETEVTWIPKEIWFGTEKFLIDKKKLAESKYCRPLNTIPSIPSNILPGQDAGINQHPAFVQLDIEKKITEVNGIIEIKCKDVFKQNHLKLQEFYLATDYTYSQPYIHITFGGMM